MSDELGVIGAVERAMSASRAEDVIEGVKTAVAGELESLDPDADIVFTDYFNHSYVPDMLVKWKESGKKLERRVYLRNSLGAMVKVTSPSRSRLWNLSSSASVPNLSRSW